MSPNKYDAVLPAWGPYSQKYMGVSHVPDPGSLSGVRFDCVVFPTVANSGVPVPNVTVPSAYHPWNVRSDLSFFSYRYDLEWKDRVYADVSFTRIDHDATLIRTRFVNHSDLAQNCLLNYFCAIEYPTDRYCAVELPIDSMLWDATEYTFYSYANPRPWDGQNPDGAKKGEFRDARFTGGFGLGDRVSKKHVPLENFPCFGASRGDHVSYAVTLPQAYANAKLGIRYRTVGQRGVAFRMGGDASGELKLPVSDTLTVQYVPLGRLPAGRLRLELTALEGDGVELDCFFLLEAGREGGVSFTDCAWEYVPQISHEGDTALYRYAGVKGVYGRKPLTKRVRYRRLATGALEDAMISRLSNSDVTFDDVTEPFTSSFARKRTTPGFYHNTIVHSLFIPAGETHTEYAVVFHDHRPELTEEACERLYQQACPSESLGFNPAGRPFEFSNRLLKSTLLSNVVYPIYKHGTFIKHFTPGKRWDSLYTWDSGFIGLGLLESEPRLAEYVLDTYLSDTDNPDYAFLFHGSPVPTQIYLYLELLNRAADKQELLAYYPRARLYYEFLVGRTHGSTVARFPTGLTSTYDLFYSTSGMDDYPAQVYMHRHQLERRVTPCISTSQAIRFAKILRMIAAETGREDDRRTYEADIERLTRALRDYAWDADTGYFSYVVYDDQLRPTGFLCNEHGENLNKGFDGLYPLIAGACTPEQEQTLVDHLTNPHEIFSPVGLSAVDMSSGYYQDSGYWNGSVWFSHQWFFYKTMLDMGRRDVAFQIADTALRVWKREVDASYNCFEMMNIATGRGGWYHQFGGLSAPLNIWANAYYRPGTVTAGFDAWIAARRFAADKRQVGLDFHYYGVHPAYTLIVVLAPADSGYEALLDGNPADYSERCPGTLEITLPGSCRSGHLECRPNHK